MSGSSVGEEEQCEIALGPMIDCVFLLLLYYISVSSLAATQMSEKVQLPVAMQGLKEENESGRFIVDIEWDEGLREATYKAGPKVLDDPRDLVTLIEKSARMEPKNFRVVIRADYMTPYEYTQQVMAAVAQANVPNIMISTVSHKF